MVSTILTVSCFSALQRRDTETIGLLSRRIDRFARAVAAHLWSRSADQALRRRPGQQAGESLRRVRRARGNRQRRQAENALRADDR